MQKTQIQQSNKFARFRSQKKSDAVPSKGQYPTYRTQERNLRLNLSGRLLRHTVWRKEFTNKIIRVTQNLPNFDLDRKHHWLIFLCNQPRLFREIFSLKNGQYMSAPKFTTKKRKRDDNPDLGFEISKSKPGKIGPLLGG